MYSTRLLLLLASIEYPNDAQAFGGRPFRRQNSTPVALWGVCNYPSQGINGPLACASGSECICKDDSTCNTHILFIIIFGLRLGSFRQRSRS